MKQVWRIARRELRSYFDHPTAYILLVAFLGMGLFLYFQALFTEKMASLRPLFDVLPWLFLVFIPAITMRTLAEERRTGTLDWLLSQPVNEVEVITGKFLGDWIFALIALGGTVPTAVGLLLVSDADPGIMVAQYLGASMLAATMVAVGLFASGTTKNQITAFILSVAVGFGLMLSGMNVVTQTLPTALAAPVGRLSVLTHFDAIARGVLDLRDVLYFVTVCFVFTSVAYYVVTRRRLSRERGAHRRLQVGVGGLVLATVILNLLGHRIQGRLDLTRNDLYTLSSNTTDVLSELDDLVTVTFYVSEELPPEVAVTRRDVRDVLQDYERYSDGMLRVEEVHPEEDGEAAEEAQSRGIEEIQFNVLRGDEFQVKTGWMGLAIHYAGETETIPVIRETDDLEYRLTSRISALTSDVRPLVSFLLGFGARVPQAFPEFNQALQERYRVASMNVTGRPVTGLEPDSVRVAVLAAPTDTLSPEAIEAVQDYLEAGGAAMVLADGSQVNPRAQVPMSTSVEPGLNALLGSWGVETRPGIVYDLGSALQIRVGRPGSFQAVRDFNLWPHSVVAGRHPILQGRTRVGFGWPRPLVVTDTSRATPLLQTTPRAGIRATGTPASPYVELSTSPDSLGTRILATASRGSDGRLVVVGDATFLESWFVQNNPQNVNFASNAVDWLAQEEGLIGIRAKDRTPARLVFEGALEQGLLKWLNLVGVPLLFVLYGAFRILRRRRLASRGWDEAPVS